jgi:hypothetical protein
VLPQVKMTVFALPSYKFSSFCCFVQCWSADVIWFSLSLDISVRSFEMQVMWSTFVPFIPNSVLPGIICGSLAVAAVAMVRRIILSCIKQFLFINSGITWMPQVKLES